MEGSKQRKSSKLENIADEDARKVAMWQGLTREYLELLGGNGVRVFVRMQFLEKHKLGTGTAQKKQSEKVKERGEMRVGGSRGT